MATSTPSRPLSPVQAPQTGIGVRADSAVQRPRDCEELFALMLTGQKAEVRSKTAALAIQWLGSAGTTWKIDVKPSVNEGFHVLTPDPVEHARFQREALRDEADDLAAERALEPHGPGASVFSAGGSPHVGS